jgi:very-short-patch-repair endonuclease
MRKGLAGQGTPGIGSWPTREDCRAARSAGDGGRRDFATSTNQEIRNVTSRYQVDALILETAARQHGVVSRRQLLRLGVSRDTIERRRSAGLLRALHRGVYRVGPVAGPYAREMAAVLATDGAGVASHRSAAALWGLLPRRDDEEPVELVVVGGGVRRRHRVHVYRVQVLPRDEVTTLDHVPLTTPARTLVDLAGAASGRELERVWAHMERENLARRSDLVEVLARRPRCCGAGKLRALLAPGRAPAFTRSEAEERLLALVRKAQLRAPETNVRIDSVEVDFYWHAERLVVEVDGYAYHASPRAFERDRRRDARLTARGLRIMRVTWRQIAEEPEATLARLAQALAH